MNLSEKYDITFLWVGTNDVLAHTSMLQSAIKVIFNQTWTENKDEFRECYIDIINTISPVAKKIFTVSPLLLGEDIENEWNKKLECLSGEIRDLSFEFENVEYINLQKEFFSFLSSKKPSLHMLESTGAISDYLAKTSGDINRISHKRGLHVTIDGAHLNNVGAQMVADTFYKIITGEIRK